MSQLLRTYAPPLLAFALGLGLMFIFKPGDGTDKAERKRLEAQRDRARFRADSLLSVANNYHVLYLKEMEAAAKQEQASHGTAAKAVDLRNQTHAHAPKTSPSSPAYNSVLQSADSLLAGY